jgi:hypothetical protein
MGSGVNSLAMKKVAVNKFIKHSWIAEKWWSKYFRVVLQAVYCKPSVALLDIAFLVERE